MNKKISVIVPVYNVEQYVGRCLESLFKQTYADMEIIIVNDGSTDNSVSICEMMQKKDSRIIIISQKNGGLSRARNTGLKNATGEYCYFLDSDDYLEPDFIFHVAEEMDQQQADCLIFNYRKLDASYREIVRLEVKEEEYILSTARDYIDFILGKYLSSRVASAVWNKMYSMDIIRRHNLSFYPNQEIFAEDICFNLVYFTYCKKIITKNWQGYNYLIRKDSLAQKAKKIKIDEFARLTQVVECHYKKDKYLAQYVPFIMLGLLAREFWCYKTGSFCKALDNASNKEYVLAQAVKAENSGIAPGEIFSGYLKGSIYILEKYLCACARHQDQAANCWLQVQKINRLYRIFYRGTERIRKRYW